ncbi:MAG: SMP-30/gluconolactonase/LRE family protein [Armatimonadetes bacterium]|nr:SMP-30/gluconolactonase/LRE family protein [Armatimonadota bacterium]
MRKVIFYSNLLMLILLFSVESAFAQNLLNQPESVTWDHINEQWLVSNYATGEIVAVDTTGEQSFFSELLSSTVGLKVHGDKLYAAAIDCLAIFDLVSGYIEGLINIPEAILLNDLDFDSQGNLFVSDFEGNKIYKINTELHSYELFIDYGVFSPNGLIFDEEFNRMIVCGHNNSVSVIHSFDVSTAETELLLYPTIYSLDGLARDLQGSIYVSSWYTDAVYKFDGNNINNNYEIAASGFINPADIFINSTNNILAVPNFSGNSLSFVQLEMPVNIQDNAMLPITSELSNYPNPFNPETIISFGLKEDSFVLLQIYNLKGQLVKTLLDENVLAGYHEILWNGTDSNVEQVASGLYLYRMTTEDYSQIKKMLFLK